MRVRGKQSGIRSGNYYLIALYWLLLVFTVSWLFLAVPVAGGEEVTLLEAKLTHFIKQFYGEGDDIRIRFGTIPGYLKDNVRVKNINFSRVPDASGEGVCFVEVDGASTRARNAYVSFKVLIKKNLFVLHQGGKKGDTVDLHDITVKDTYLSGGSNLYPASRDDVIGKKLKKDLPAGTVLTSQTLDAPVLLERGEIVTIMAESKRLLVQTKGQALEKGRLGDIIRVKNITSGKQLMGRITADNIVIVAF
jgi:flagella basal body P-ring formation protein FlgA